TWRLPALVGEALASEMLFTGRLLGADEALRAGLITAIHPADALMDAAHAIADRIGANDPLAIRHTKTALRAPQADHPRIDSELQAELFESPEKMRRMTEFLAKRGRP
ncbi:MAG TPA: enoyl-CoA hydratase-related protein, partial [Microbacterium sp.]|nr:enoyl-CoA hydratase-related protein [Microbacterium sp.]